MITKITLSIVALLAFIYACQWSFNHINPWLSILFTIAGIAVIAGIVTNFVKKQINKDNENN